MVMLSVDMPIGERVAPHTHAHEDQAIIVVSGTVGATLADEEFELTAGGPSPIGAMHSPEHLVAP
jgi:quercetin dioxygenase-like cupin family protein